MLAVNGVSKTGSSQLWDLSRRTSKQIIMMPGKRQWIYWIQIISIRTMAIYFAKFTSISYPTTSCYCYHSGFVRRPFSTMMRNIKAIRSLTTSISNDSVDNTEWATLRKDLLKASLLELHVDAESLHAAAIGSIHNPLAGYDTKFGKSAIRAYRSFAWMNEKKVDSTHKHDLKATKAMADRVARQVQFLLNRHKAHQVNWIRHHDQDTQINESDQSIHRKTRFPIIIVLDNVRSALNVGNIFRTADAAGCEAIYTTGITPHPGGNGFEKLQKSALGAEQTVPHLHFRTLQDALTQIKQINPPNCIGLNTDEIKWKSHPYTIVGMETTSKSISYTNFMYDQSRGVALILGNEVTGIDVDVLTSEELLDAIIEIPMYGVKNSLNIAACAPIVIYEIIRQWNH
jgi:23S rRNA (guanosine2251-2'-O)-methyltransferase